MLNEGHTLDDIGAALSAPRDRLYQEVHLFSLTRPYKRRTVSQEAARLGLKLGNITLAVDRMDDAAFNALMDATAKTSDTVVNTLAKFWAQHHS